MKDERFKEILKQVLEAVGDFNIDQLLRERRIYDFCKAHELLHLLRNYKSKSLADVAMDMTINTYLKEEVTMEEKKLHKAWYELATYAFFKHGLSLKKANDFLDGLGSYYDFDNPGHWNEMMQKILDMQPETDPTAAQVRIGKVVVDAIGKINEMVDKACGLVPEYIQIEITYTRSLGLEEISVPELKDAAVFYGAVREINIKTGEIESGCEFQQLRVKGETINI